MQCFLFAFWNLRCEESHFQGYLYRSKGWVFLCLLFFSVRPDVMMWSPGSMSWNFQRVASSWESHKSAASWPLWEYGATQIRMPPAVFIHLTHCLTRTVDSCKRRSRLQRPEMLVTVNSLSLFLSVCIKIFEETVHRIVFRISNLSKLQLKLSVNLLDLYKAKAISWKADLVYF